MQKCYLKTASAVKMLILENPDKIIDFKKKWGRV